MFSVAMVEEPRQQQNAMVGLKWASPLFNRSTGVWVLSSTVARVWVLS